jgi:L-lactate dehydrogenase complex protein LldE
MEASLFITCICDSFYPQVGEAMVSILRKQGVKLDFPPEQVCCGQPAFNAGYWEDAREVAKTTLKSFQKSKYVIVPSGSCVAFMKEYYPILFDKDPKYRDISREIADKTYEFSQFMIDILKVDELNSRFPYKVAYHSSCHAMRLLGVTPKVIELLKMVKDLELVNFAHPEDCCGFGGTFSVKMPEISEAMVDEKVAHITESGAEIITGTDMGCLMNIGGRLKKQGSSIRPLHIAELIYEGMKQ